MDLAFCVSVYSFHMEPCTNPFTCVSVSIRPPLSLFVGARVCAQGLTTRANCECNCTRTIDSTPNCRFIVYMRRGNGCLWKFGSNPNCICSAFTHIHRRCPKHDDDDVDGVMCPIHLYVYHISLMHSRVG